MFFSVITKNLNWEILPKNFVAFKYGMGLRIENFNTMGDHWKIWSLGRQSQKKIYVGRNCLKRGAWTVCRFKSGIGKQEVVLFLTEDWYSNVHYGSATSPICFYIWFHDLIALTDWTYPMYQS